MYLSINNNTIPQTALSKFLRIHQDPHLKQLVYWRFQFLFSNLLLVCMDVKHNYGFESPIRFSFSNLRWLLKLLGVYAFRFRTTVISISAKHSPCFAIGTVILGF